MANDHYISRFLTKPWEVRQRRLHYYDFAAGRFDEGSSESLFADEDLHTEATGKLLDRTIESPVSDYRSRVLRTSAAAALVDTGDWRVYRGLAGLVLLQGLRCLEARRASVPISLDRLLERGETVLEEMASLATQQYDLLGLTVPSTERLYFPETAYFLVPLLSGPPILGVPLSPRHFISLAPKDCDKKQLQDWVNTRAAISAFSLGVGGRANRVVLPPEYIPARDKNPATFELGLRQMREGVRGLVTMLEKTSKSLGLPAWGLSPHRCPPSAALVTN